MHLKHVLTLYQRYLLVRLQSTYTFCKLFYHQPVAFFILCILLSVADTKMTHAVNLDPSVIFNDSGKGQTVIKSNLCSTILLNRESDPVSKRFVCGEDKNYWDISATFSYTLGWTRLRDAEHTSKISLLWRTDKMERRRSSHFKHVCVLIHFDR